MIILKTIQLVVITIMGAALWLFASVGIHELGHVFGAKTMTKDEYSVQKVQIWPALEVYPDVKFTPETTEPLGDTKVQMIGEAASPVETNTVTAGELPAAVQSVRLGTRVAGLPQRAEESLAPADPVQLEKTREEADRSVITLMGSVMTGFVSVLAVVCLICFNLTGIKMFLASVLGMLHLDATLYSFFPSIGLPHLAVVGTQPEPIAALAYFGIVPMWSFTVFALLSFLQLGLVIHHWQKQDEN